MSVSWGWARVVEGSGLGSARASQVALCWLMVWPRTTYLTSQTSVLGQGWCLLTLRVKGMMWDRLCEVQEYVLPNSYPWNEGGADVVILAVVSGIFPTYMTLWSFTQEKSWPYLSHLWKTLWYFWEMQLASDACTISVPWIYSILSENLSGKEPQTCLNMGQERNLAFPSNTASGKMKARTQTTRSISQTPLGCSWPQGNGIHPSSFWQFAQTQMIFVS